MKTTEKLRNTKTEVVYKRKGKMEKTLDVYHQILTLPLFTADDDYEVEAFIKEVEEKSLRYKWTSRQQFLIAKKKLGGTAALWLRAEDPFSDWEELKHAIRREFCNGEFCEDLLPVNHKYDDIDDEFLTHDSDAQPFAQEVSTAAMEVAVSDERKNEETMEETAELTRDMQCQNENVIYRTELQEHKTIKDAAINEKITLITENVYDTMRREHTHFCEEKRRMFNNTSQLQEYYSSHDLGKSSHHDGDSFDRTTMSNDPPRFDQGRTTLFGLTYDAFLCFWKFRYCLFGVLLSC